MSCLALDESALGTGCEMYFQCLDWSDQCLEVTISTCTREYIQYIVLNRRSRSSQDSQPSTQDAVIQTCNVIQAYIINTPQNKLTSAANGESSEFG